MIFFALCNLCFGNLLVTRLTVVVVQQELLPVNLKEFMRMAHGDPIGLMEIANDFFRETRGVITEWVKLIESGDFFLLREEFHRCKGGASLFGLERLVAILDDLEKSANLEQWNYDIRAFERELTDAENALRAMEQEGCH